MKRDKALAKAEANRIYEIGRYQKKVADQQKEIRELKAQIEGWQQVMEMDQAIIAAVLMVYGANEEKPITVSKKVIADIMKEVRVIAMPTEDAYKMHYEYIKAE